MSLAKDVRIWLDRQSGIDSNPTARIFARWSHAGFAPADCRRALEELVAEGAAPAAWFDPAAITSGGRPANDTLLFPTTPTDGAAWSFGAFAAKTRGCSAQLGAAEARLVADLLRGSSDDVAAAHRRWSDLVSPALADRALAAPPPTTWMSATAPGIYRREHASLVIRSRTTTLLLDPLSREWTLPNLAAAPSPPSSDRFDALLVSHGHGDHWNVASILSEVRRADTLVVVPAVPRVNLLTRVPFADALAELGQRVVAPAWGTTLRIGDIEIDVLPFYGEQPTRDLPGFDPALRNWGNCYRFNTPDFSAIVLVDSGADPAGDMIDALEASFAKRGPADVVLSCLRVFPSPFFGGLPDQVLTLSFDQLLALRRANEHGALPSTTAGPTGTAAACRAARARYFLPYAHGIERAGAPVTDVGWGEQEPSETALLDALAAALADAGATTAVHSWNPGDCAIPDGNGLAILPALASA